ncbi:MAG: RsmD family RNA methyltransferase [Patescibacteria group bacterium]
MARYGFILGKNPQLSLAEIFSYEAVCGVRLTIVDLTSNALIVDSSGGIDADAWQHALGGCIKIGSVTSQYQDLDALIEGLSLPNIKQLLAQGERKVIFGFSLYGEVSKQYRTKLKSVGLDLKRQIRRSGLPGRFIAAEDGALTSVQIEKNKVLDRGADILVINGIHASYLGTTLTIQDFEEYSRRDYGRPNRDARSGMLPPKLAKIMLNLGGVRSDSRLLDPFCGSGTILQEALLRGVRHITGSDISSKAMLDTKKNLAWLATQYGAAASTRAELYECDVKNLAGKLAPGSIDLIVTEPYLGPPNAKNADAQQMLGIIAELESLYLSAFTSFASILKPRGAAVIVFPLFTLEHGVYTLKILEQLHAMGFCRANPFPEKMSLFAKAGPTARGSIIYQRPDQKVQREIFIFKKT